MQRKDILLSFKLQKIYREKKILPSFTLKKIQRKRHLPSFTL